MIDSETSSGIIALNVKPMCYFKAVKLSHFSNITLSHIDKTDKLNSPLSREGSIWPPSSFILNLDNNLQNIFSP